MRLAEALSRLRADAGTPVGALRCVLPGRACEGYLRAFRGRPPDREIAETCRRWVEEDYGVDPASNDLHVSVYDFGEVRVGAVTAARPGLADEYARAAAERGLRDVAFVSPLDALMHLAEQTAAEQPEGALSAFLHVERSSCIVLLLEGPAPVFFREVRRELETDGADGDLYEQMRPGGPRMAFLTPASVQAVVDEFARTVAFYKRSSGRPEGELQQLWITTGGLDARPVAARAEEVLQAQARPAAPPPGLDVDEALAKEQLIGDNWAQFALAQAVALAPRLKAQRCLARVEGRAAKAFSPKVAAAACAAVLALLMGGWWGAGAAERRSLEAERDALRQKQGGLQSELNRRRSDLARREEHRAAARALLRMKHQGVFAAGLLGALDSHRPSDALRFHELSLEPGGDLCAVALVVALPGRVGVTQAMADVNEYVARLRADPRFRSVRIEQPSPVIEGTRGSGARAAEGQTRTGDASIRFRIAAEAETPWAKGEGQ